MTASERRAAGEAEFCSCSGCVANAPDDLFRALCKSPLVSSRWYSIPSENGAIALLRALVVQALLTGWGEP